MDSELANSWLPIIDYSVKTGVSLSTIRRKIKSNSIQFKLEKGKYLILYGSIRSPDPVPQQNPAPYQEGSVEQPPKGIPTQATSTSEEPFRMMTDAFEYALREKEERIRLLERRNHDLESHLDEMRLLIQVLEEKYEVRY